MLANFGKKVGLGVALATMTLSSTVPAQAQRRDGWNQQNGVNWNRWNRNRRRNNESRVAGAVVGGILALGIGAAIASSVENDNRRRAYEERLRENDYYQSQDPYGVPQRARDPYYPR